MVRSHDRGDVSSIKEEEGAAGRNGNADGQAKQERPGGLMLCKIGKDMQCRTGKCCVGCKDRGKCGHDPCEDDIHGLCECQIPEPGERK